MIYFYSCRIKISTRKCDYHLYFCCIHAPFGIIRVIFLLGREKSQPNSPLQGIIQLKGLVALYPLRNVISNKLINGMR